MRNLIYVSVGNFQDYIFHSIFQTRLYNQKNTIYVILNESDIVKYKDTFDNFKNIKLISMKELDNIEPIIPNNDLINSESFSFRNYFWIYTLLRFFYIAKLINKFQLKYSLHIENDVMLYTDFSKIKADFRLLTTIQDSKNRAVCSILSIPNYERIKELIDYINEKTCNLNKWGGNDMEILGSFKKKVSFNCLDVENYNYIYDGASLGQYLGGIDPNNNSNNTIGFINETCILKPNNYKFEIKNTKIDNTITEFRPNSLYLKEWFLIHNKNNLKIMNLHIHSKKLYNFSSINYINPDTLICHHHKDYLITGEKILHKCDMVLLDNNNFYFHQHILQKFNGKIVKIKNFENKEKFILLLDYISHNHDSINIFIFGDIFKKLVLSRFFEFDNLEFDNFKINLFVGNSDENFNSNNNVINCLLSKNFINEMYIQNLNIPATDKLKILPIGIANSLWNHGNLNTFTQVFNENYYKKKIDKIYVNINTDTYYKRKEWKTQFVKLKEKYPDKIIIEEKSLDFKSYLEKIMSYRYIFCPRGNGLDTHRFWETIYYNSIPIIINDTDSSDFIKNLYSLNLYFLKINEISDNLIHKINLQNLDINPPFIQDLSFLHK